MRNYQFITRPCNAGFKGVTMLLNNTPLGEIIVAIGTSTYTCRTFFYHPAAKDDKLPVHTWNELSADDAKKSLMDAAENFLNDL